MTNERTCNTMNSSKRSNKKQKTKNKKEETTSQTGGQSNGITNLNSKKSLNYLHKVGREEIKMKGRDP